MESYLELEDPLEKGDIVYVPAGNWMYRVPRALLLLKDGWANHIYVGLPATAEKKTGLYEKYGVPSPADTAKDYVMLMAEKEGLPETRLTFIEGNKSTLEEMENLLKEREKRKFTTVIIVTEPLYTRRTKNLFNRVFEDRNVKSVLVPSCTKDESREFLLEKRDYKIAVFVETLKYIYYVLLDYLPFKTDMERR